MDKKQSLILNNIWWNNENIDSKFLLTIKRSEFKDIIIKLEEKRILSIIGPRRVGKSTLIYQVIDYLLKEKKVDPKRILFFSGDDPSIFFNEKDKLSDIIELYFNEILCEPINKIKERIYIFIDEIHFIKDWQNYLKYYFDRKYNIKFIVTGSSSTHLFKDSNESLLGRIDNTYILPLNFHQFLDFYQVYVNKKMDIDIPKFNIDNPEASIKELEGVFCNEEMKLEIQKILDEYIIVGGYPEYFENRNIEVWQKQLSSDIILRGIYKDILSQYNIKSPEILEKILYYISANNSQNFSYSNLTKIFNLDTVTIITYMGYLKQAFLINILENYSSNISKIIRTNKKISILDNGILNSLLKRKVLNSEETGHIIECMVDFNIRLLSEKENYNQYYYRNKEQEEIDIILDRKIDIIPIEVKYTNQIDEKDIKNIKKFILKNKDKALGNSKFGIIVTKNILKIEDEIIYIPFWLFNF